MSPRLAVLLASFGCWFPAAAQFDPLNAVTTQSKSGQFTVVAPSARLPDPATNDARYVTLDTERLAVACERVKEALWQELGVKDLWRGKILLTLRPTDDPETPITILTQRTREGWDYRVALPQITASVRVVRAVVNVLMLELANRRAAEHSAEVPLWLTEGLTQQLLASANVALVPAQPQYRVNGINMAMTDVSVRMRDPLRAVTNALGQRPALTFQDLSWPVEVDLDSEAGASYRASAQLFVIELMTLKNGQATLLKMVEKLPEFYNWQTAFLDAYRGEFARTRDVEKWWTLAVVHFTGRNLDGLWTREQSWEKLDEIIRTPMEVGPAKSQSPLRREATLQRVIRDLDFSRQKTVLNDKIQQLAALRQFAAPELAGLVDDYRRVLGDYVTQRERLGGTLLAKNGFSSTGGIVIREALRALDFLDARRTALGSATLKSNAVRRSAHP